MPIVIARTGEMNPQMPTLTPEQREKAWAYIIRTWTDKNAASFLEILKAEEAEASV